MTNVIVLIKRELKRKLEGFGQETSPIGGVQTAEKGGRRRPLLSDREVCLAETLQTFVFLLRLLCYKEVRMRCKIWHLMLRLFLVLLLSVSVTIKAFMVDDGYKHCEHAVKNWASNNSADSEVGDDKYALRDLLFFLHVPRTGGLAYLRCFLKKLYSNSQACPWSYTKLTFNPRKLNCSLLSTHDDYSVMSKLPKEKTSVMTIIRDPIDRVFSTYEFSMELAARFMPNSAHSKPYGGTTLDIWPWKYLVPWIREDLIARRDARKLRGQVHLVTNDTYDMGDILMPLHDYINNPLALDLIHNGATFQIVGLTNNSYFVEAHEVRQCVLKYRSLGEYVLEVAKKRLDNMLYVGLTENHKESANMFTNIVGAKVISQHKISAMEAYESCISPSLKFQADLRTSSLKRISSANFSKEARRKVPEGVIHKIASLNHLDVELHKYAQEIFRKQQARMMQETVVGLSWKCLSLSITAHMLLLFILLFVKSRRTSKVKL